MFYEGIGSGVSRYLGGGGIDLFGAGRFVWKGALIELKLKLSDKKAIRD